MIELLQLFLHILASLFKSKATLEAEILVLRQQLNVLRRQVSKRPQLNNTDRVLLVWLYRWFPSVIDAIANLRPETIIRWHRTGFRAYWLSRSGNRIGRPAPRGRTVPSRSATFFLGVIDHHTVRHDCNMKKRAATG